MNDWMNKLRDRFARFMYGRYGSDEFSRFLLYAALVLMILGVFLRTPLFRYLGIASLIGCYFRMFSKDMDARRRENSWYLGKKQQVLQFVSSKKNHAADLKDHHIYRCPNCGQKIRVPRGRGRIVITCPKCRTEFTKNS